MLKRRSTLQGMQIFTVIWFGQFVSALGTGMTRFALLIWAYQQTGDATTLALLGFFSFGPYVLLGPIAGVWVDRLDRRLVMLFTDLGAGLMTIAMLVLYTTGNLQIWHLYIASGMAGAFEAFQLTAYSAATTTLAPKAHLARASGMRSLGTSAAEVFAPFLAGMMLTLFDIDGVMLIDVATFLIAMLTLSLVRIPAPTLSEEGINARGNMRQEITFGFRYIFRRPGLLGLLLIFVGINLFAALTYFAILPPMVLARTGGDELALASVQSALGIGGVAGGVVLTIRGGPKRQIHGVLAAASVSFLLGDFLFATGRSAPVWVLAAFLAAFFIPFIIGADRAIWQAKVPPDIQGRVLSVQSTLRTATMPIGYLLAGPLADQVFEPAMAAGGSLAESFGWLVGTGPGAGMALMFLCTAILGCAMSLSGYLFRPVRQVENDLPDYDVVPLKTGADPSLSTPSI